VGVLADKIKNSPGGAIQEILRMVEKLLNESIAQQVRELFEEQIRQPVSVLYFGQQDNCDYCSDTQQLIEEVVELSDKLDLTIYDLKDDAGVANQYRVDKAPSLVLLGRDGEELIDYGIHYAGIPAGHEFGSLIQSLILVSSRDSGLSQSTRQALKDLQEPVQLLIFTTPTCGYCPPAVVLAHRMALETPMIEAEMVEAMEFPELSDRYGVSGVPQTTINFGAGTVVGAVPEDHLLAEIQRTVSKVLSRN
jgi:glutaredoxin-like protein